MDRSLKRKHDDSNDSASEATDTFDLLYDVSDDDSKNGTFAAAAPCSRPTKTRVYSTQERNQATPRDTTIPTPEAELADGAIDPESTSNCDTDFEIIGETKLEDLETITELPNRLHAINPDDVLDQVDRLALLVKNTVYAQVTPAIWAEACTFLGWSNLPKVPGTVSEVVQMVKIPGMLRELEDWQGLAVFFHIKKMTEAGGSFNWDNPGLGKTVMALATLVVAFQVNEAHWRWRTDCADPEGHLKHCAQSDVHYIQPPLAECPSQEQRSSHEERGVQCPCIEKSVTRQLKENDGPILLLLPRNGLDTWSRAFDAFIGPNSPMKVELWIAYGQQKPGQAARTLDPVAIKAKLARVEWGKDRQLNHIMIATTMWSYKSHVSTPTMVTDTVTYRQNGTLVERELRHRGIAWGHVVIDEHQSFKHHTSKAAIVLDDLASFGGPINVTQLQACEREGKRTLALDEGQRPTYLFLSGTPYKQAPDDIRIYLQALEAKSWTASREGGRIHPCSKATVDSIVKISNRTRKLIAAGTKNEEVRKEDVNQIATDTAAALGALVISRNESSLWFGRTLKTLPRLRIFVRTIHIADRYLEHMEGLRKKEYGTMVDEYGDNHITLGTWNHSLRRYRVCSSFPALAKIAMDRELSLTATEMYKQRWHMNTNSRRNPYLTHFAEITNSSRKLTRMMEDLKTRPKNTKFLVFSDYPVMLYIVQRVSLLCVSPGCRMRCKPS